MNCPGILNGDDAVLDKLIAAYEAKKPIDGHSPGISGKDLQAYASARIRTDTNVSPWMTSKRASRPVYMSCCATARPAMTCPTWSRP